MTVNFYFVKITIHTNFIIILIRISNIKFTIEIEQENSLPYFDAHVKKSGNACFTDKHESSIDHRYKTNLVNCLIDRAYKLISTYHILMNEIKKIKNVV